MKRAIIGVLAISLGILIKSCNTTEPPPPNGEKPTLELKLEDVSCTEAWIELTTTNLQLPATITLKQTNPTGDTKSDILNLNTKDSLLYVDSLLPNQAYKFHTTIQSSSHTSNELNVTTMDTTSHNFTFETFTFGDIGNSVLFDVAIVNDNNIWAVGEINIADSSINGYTTYNAVHWNGSQWELKRINMLSSCNPVTYPPLKAIWAFSESNIVITSGGSIGWFDGVINVPDCSIRPLLTGSINKIWGSSSNDIYVVGNNGNIARYLNGTWSRIESGTELNINDIWGDYNEKTGEWEILAVASNKFFNEGKTILKIDGLFANEINVVGLPWSLSSVWFRSEKKYYVGGDGLYYKKLLSDNWVKDGTFITIYKDRIRGADINDIIISGSNGLLSHYNGIFWYHYINNELPYYSGRLLSCDIKDNIIVAVGWKEIEAIITMGKR